MPIQCYTITRRSSSRSKPSTADDVRYRAESAGLSLLVKVRCPDSLLLMSVTIHGDQTGEQYSMTGRT